MIQRAQGGLEGCLGVQGGQGRHLGDLMGSTGRFDGSFDDLQGLHISEILTLTGMTSSLNLLHDINQLQLKTFDVYLLQKSSYLGQMLK